MPPDSDPGDAGVAEHAQPTLDRFALRIADAVFRHHDDLDSPARITSRRRLLPGLASHCSSVRPVIALKCVQVAAPSFRAITSGGRSGPGASRFHPDSISQLRTYCLSQLSGSPPGLPRRRIPEPRTVRGEQFVDQRQNAVDEAELEFGVRDEDTPRRVLAGQRMVDARLSGSSSSARSATDFVTQLGDRDVLVVAGIVLASRA